MVDMNRHSDTIETSGVITLDPFTTSKGFKGMAFTTMAKARRKATPDAKPEPGPTRKNVLAIQGTEAWRAWLQRYATHKRMPMVVLVDTLLAEAAKRDGFEDPPER